MTYEEWHEKFKPIKNHLDDNASFDGYMFETYGPELSFVRDNNSNQHIWTILDCDGETIVASGYHHVNRMGYLITQNPHNKDIDFNTAD